MAYGRNQKSNGIAHNWAHQLESKFKKDTGEGSNFYYDGKTIYSYGRHFPIAVIHEDKKRGNVTFLTTRSYSNTTGGHISVVRSACSHHTVIYCVNPDQADRGTHEENLKSFEYAAKSQAEHLPKAKKPEKYLSAIAYQRELAEKYAAYFKIKLTAKKYPYLFIVSRDGGNKASADEIKRAEKLRLQKEKQLTDEFNKGLECFRNFTNWHGEPMQDIVRFSNPKDHNAAYLRYNKGSKRIETSKGIQIPVELGKRFYNWLKTTVNKGGCIDGKCKQEILRYSLEYVNANEFKVGCHTVQMTEANVIAKLLKW